MKNVVFSEGKHDAHFMCMAINKCLTNPGIDWFIAETLDGSAVIKHKQEDAVRDFRHARSTEHLVKSEEGDGNLLKIFSYYAEDILLGKFNCTLVADLDSESMDDFATNLQSALDEIYVGSIELRNRSLEGRFGDLRTWVGELYFDGRNVARNFNIITFDENLEVSAGLNRRANWTTKSYTLNDFARNDDVQGLISPLLK